MRKGDQRKDWTVEEEAFLKKNAGKAPVDDLSEMLGRSIASIKQKALYLNRQGACISLRYIAPRTVACPVCGHMRSRIGQSGMCRPCELRKLIQKADEDTAVAMQRLSAAQREIYNGNEPKIGSRIDPMPPLPALPKNDARKEKRMIEDYDLACEKVEIVNLNRRLKAKRRRCERMCEKFVNKGNE